MNYKDTSYESSFAEVSVVNDRWKSSDYKNLIELWEEEISLEEIASTLEKSLLSTIKKIAWKTGAKISEVTKRFENKEYLSQIIQVYVSDYPQLVDIEVDQNQRERLIEQYNFQKKQRLETFYHITFSTEEIKTTNQLSGLEVLIAKLFLKDDDINKLAGNVIRKKLVMLSALSELFDRLEYEIFFTVFPNDGGLKKTYSEVSDLIEVPEYKVAEITRSCINKLLHWIDLLGNDNEAYKDWTIIPKETLLEMNFKNRVFTLPNVDISYEKIPKMLIPLSEFGFPESSVKQLFSAGFFCLGDLKKTDYQELRLVHGIKSNLATDIINIYEAHKYEF
jgi:hypothetical protein